MPSGRERCHYVRLHGPEVPGQKKNLTFFAWYIPICQAWADEFSENRYGLRLAKYVAALRGVPAGRPRCQIVGQHVPEVPAKYLRGDVIM